jgi:hypothetical protein
MKVKMYFTFLDHSSATGVKTTKKTKRESRKTVEHTITGKAQIARVWIAYTPSRSEASNSVCCM